MTHALDLENATYLATPAGTGIDIYVIPNAATHQTDVAALAPADAMDIVYAEPVHDFDDDVAVVGCLRALVWLTPEESQQPDVVQHVAPIDTYCWIEQDVLYLPSDGQSADVLDEDDDGHRRPDPHARWYDPQTGQPAIFGLPGTLMVRAPA
ncbi:MAG TPA: hypothetical protein VII06_09550 [Chloroflexota bacterium]|jgi:hypothetical protein